MFFKPLNIWPTFSHIPNLVTINFAIFVALSKSLDAPGEEEETTKTYAAFIKFQLKILFHSLSHIKTGLFRNSVLPVVMFS